MPLVSWWRRAQAVGARASASYDPRQRAERATFRALRASFYRGLWRDAAGALGASVDELGDGFLRIRQGRSWTVVRGAAVMLDDHLSLELCGSKPVMARLLGELGVRVPRHRSYTLADLGPALELLDELEGPVVVKPADGAAGRGVTTGVRGRAALSRASVRAAQGFGSPLLVEEQVAGASFRLLFLGGRFVDAIRRDGPTVRGDGVQTLAALVRAETHRRASAAVPIALHPLHLDLEARQHLHEQGLNERQVPTRDQVVVVKRVPNQNAARDNHVVRQSVHASVVEHTARIVDRLGLQLAGVDVIAPDLAAPLDHRLVVNEVNTTPGLHHHRLVSDPACALGVGRLVLEHALSANPRRALGA